MILFKSRLYVTIDNIIANKNGRCIVTEATFAETKIVFVNICDPNHQTYQVQFLRDLSQTIINQYANERMVLGGDFNCALNDLDKRNAEADPLITKETSSRN